MALVAGATIPLAVVLGASMTLLQFAIGGLNDLVDAPADTGRKPGKPIPAGLVSERETALVVALSAAAGLVIALAVDPRLALIGLLGLGVGAWYDLRAKGTALSWLPMAVGIPLLPVFGWFGATGALPALFVVLVPAAANAGAALAVANALVDVERDREAGQTSIALVLGPTWGGLVVIGLVLVVALLTTGTALVAGAPGGWVLAVAASCLVPFGGAVLSAAAARRPNVAWREAAFEILAVGIGLVAVAWLAALSAASGAPLGG